MKKVSIVLILGSLLFSSLSYARGCKDEPERCPVLKMTCSSRVSADKFLSAAIYESLFSGEVVRVSETVCAQSGCLTQTLAGSFEIHPTGQSHTLINKVTGETFSIQCSSVNGGNL